jgi:ubiquinone/menaquinone biosynthesis C-methylase UbiE
MNPKELYEKQYGEKKISSISSLLFLRKVFKKFDVNREDLALSLLEKNGGNFLDVGCGNGSFAFKAKEKFDEIYGIDISPSRIQEAKKTAKERFPNNNNFHFYVQDINEKIGFSDSTFDVVTCLAVLEHIFDPYFIAKEIYRILKNNGTLILEVPNIAYLKHRIQLLLGKLPVTSSPLNWREIGCDGGHLHYFTKKTLCRLLEEEGFKILKISGCGLFAKFRNWWPSLLTGDIFIKAKK